MQLLAALFNVDDFEDLESNSGIARQEFRSKSTSTNYQKPDEHTGGDWSIFHGSCLPKTADSAILRIFEESQGFDRRNSAPKAPVPSTRCLMNILKAIGPYSMVHSCLKLPTRRY